MNTILSQVFSWSFPRWSADLLPVSEAASLPGCARLQGAQTQGLGTSHFPRTKEQLLEVISVFLDQLYFHLASHVFPKSDKGKKNLENLDSFYKHLRYTVQQENKLNALLD